LNEIVFEVSQEGNGGFVAECLTEAIFTEADNCEELQRNVKEAVAAYYFEQARPVRGDPPPPGARRIFSSTDEDPTRPERLRSGECALQGLGLLKSQRAVHQEGSHILSLVRCPLQV